jgi:copper chaperone CopZ
MSETIELKIEGMHCDGCVRRVTALLKKVEGAEVEQVVVGAARVKVGPEGPGKAELVRAVEAGGFTAQG